MKKLLWLGLACGLAIPAGLLRAGPNTIPLYENYGSISVTPEIDAYAFANYGEFIVLATLPYDTSNTLAYTNRGTMLGGPGFRFEHVNDAGFRTPARTFRNESGTIEVQGVAGAVIPGGAGYISYPGLLLVRATNVLNRGALSTDISGLLRLEGENVDISRSSIGVQPLLYGGGFNSPINGIYFPDNGTDDMYWAVGPDVIDVTALLRSVRNTLTGTAPNHCVTNSNPGNCIGQRFTLNSPYVFAYTNAVSPTNWIIQVAAVATRDTNVTVGARFQRSRHPTNFFQTVTVQLASYLTNVATGSQDLLTLYVEDTLASDTNTILLTNAATGDIPYRSGTYLFTRDTPGSYALGAPGNFTNTAPSNIVRLLYNPGGPGTNFCITNIVTNANPPNATSIVATIDCTTVTNEGNALRFVTNVYAAGGWRVQNLIQLTPPAPGTTLTNAAGRIEIVAGNLNMEKVRIRGEGSVVVMAKHLLTSKNAGVDAPNLYYNLGSTNGLLTVQSLAKSEVERLRGNVYAWSATWTNQLLIVTNQLSNVFTTNITVDPANPGPPTIDTTNEMFTNIVTNVIEVGYHVLMVDSSLIATRQNVQVAGFEALSTNVYFDDPMRISQTLRVEAEALTVGTNGELRLTGTLEDWTRTNFPGLKYLTNYGLVVVPSVARWGSDGPTPYARVVNRGTNAAFAYQVKTDEFDNGGLTYAAASFGLEAKTVKLEGGSMSVGGDTTIMADELKLRNHTNTTSRTLNLSIKDRLTDSGSDANGAFSAGEGINLWVKPAVGDLLGTRLTLASQRFQSMYNRWAAEDRGPSRAGYSDNVAVGRLVIDAALDSEIVFSGTGAKNALYVDFLEMTTGTMADLENTLLIDTNLVIYFAAANVPVTQLDGKFADTLAPLGRLRWVSDYAGPNSSVDVALPNGQTVRVSRGYRESLVLDTDADGTANGLDLQPFDGVSMLPLTLTNTPALAAVVAWRGAPSVVYSVEYSTNLSQGGWKPLRTVTNTALTVGPVTLTDPVPGGSFQRYYRVGYAP